MGMGEHGMVRPVNCMTRNLFYHFMYLRNEKVFESFLQHKCIGQIIDVLAGTTEMDILSVMF